MERFFFFINTTFQSYCVCIYIFIYRASAVIPNSPTKLSNGSVSHGPTSQSSVGGVINVSKGSSAVDVNKLGTAPPQYAAVAALAPAGSASGVKQGKSPSGADQLSLSATPASVSAVDSSASDPVLMPAISQHPGPVSTAKQGTGSQGIATEPSDLQKNKHISQDVSELELSKNEKAASRTMSSMNKKRETSKSKAVQKNKVSETLQPSSSASEGSLAISSSSDCASQSTQESVVPTEGYFLGYLLHFYKHKNFCSCLKLYGIMCIACVEHF